jgi:hypothetical protein
MSKWNPIPTKAGEMSKYDNQRITAVREARLLRASGKETLAKAEDAKAVVAEKNYMRIYKEMENTPATAQGSRDRPNAGGGSKRRRKKRKYTKKRKSSRKRRSRARTRRRRR